MTFTRLLKKYPKCKKLQRLQPFVGSIVVTSKEYTTTGGQERLEYGLLFKPKTRKAFQDFKKTYGLCEKNFSFNKAIVGYVSESETTPLEKLPITISKIECAKKTYKRLNFSLANKPVDFYIQAEIPLNKYYSRKAYVLDFCKKENAYV